MLNNFNNGSFCYVFLLSHKIVGICPGFFLCE